MMRNTVMLCALSSSFAHFLAALCSAEADADARAARKQEFLAGAGEAVRAYRFTDPADPQAEFKLHPEPVLTWTNPVGGDWDGAVFLWTSEGRPQAVASVYQGYHLEGQPISHELHSLSLDAFTAERQDRTVWRPKTAGVELKPIPEAQTPADSPKRRLLQMRLLARRFTARKTDRDGTERTLRLLPQPLFRYDSTDDALLDGTLFVFTQATDPEIFLLIEAREYEGSFRWYYALARMNSTAFEVSYAGRSVWEVSRVDGRTTLNRESVYNVFYRQ